MEGTPVGDTDGQMKGRERLEVEQLSLCDVPTTLLSDPLGPREDEWMFCETCDRGPPSTGFGAHQLIASFAGHVAGGHP